jgi:hypothetical protein
MKLLYLTRQNLEDNLFIKDLIHNFKYPLETKVLMLHEPFGSAPRDTRFVTKRLSTLFSETMTYNNAFMAQQRNLFQRQDDGGYHVNVKLIERLLTPINLLIVGPIIDGPSGDTMADPLALLEAARRDLPIDEVILFTSNPMSPLGRKKPLIDSQAKVDELSGVYEEESPALHLAHHLRPATLASPVNYAL